MTQIKRWQRLRITPLTCAAIRRSVIAALLAALEAQCGRRDVSVQYLRSDSYTFSRVDRATIDRIAASAESEVRRLIPTLPSPIEIIVRTGTEVIPETGETATAAPPAAVVWTVDPGRPGGVVEIARAQLRATLFHEFHHLARSAVANPRSIVEHAVFEGMATAFERDFAGANPPWGQYGDTGPPTEKEFLQLSSDAPIRQWLFQHPDGRRWIGYKVGTAWVDRAAAASGQSSATLVATPASEILSLAGVRQGVQIAKPLDQNTVDAHLRP